MLPLVLLQTDQRNHVLRRISLATSAVTTIAGRLSTTGTSDGIGANAMFNFPTGVTMTAAGDLVLIVGAALGRALPFSSPTRPITPNAD